MESTTLLYSNFYNETTGLTEMDLMTTFFPMNLDSSTSTTLPPLSDMVVYCGPGWKSFWDSFRFLILPFRVLLCVVGIVTNILNVIVFTRRPMRNPTNTILTALCLVDLISLIRLAEYLTIHLLTPFGKSQWAGTYTLAVHELASDILVQLFHVWSVYLTLTIAFWRLLGVAQPLKSRRWCSKKGANYAIATALGIGILIMIAMYFYVSIGIREFKVVNDTEIPQYGTLHSDGWYLYLQIHIIFVKVAPCCILTVVTTTLVVYLLRAKRNRTKLFKSGGTVRSPENATTNSTLTSGGEQQQKYNQELPQSVKQKLEYDRTTKMLLCVLIVFDVTEFPFAIVNMLNSILGHLFQVQCKQPMLSMLGASEYISCATSFFVYFIMSKNFRAQFFKTLKSITNSNQSSSQTTKSGGDSSSKSRSTTTIVSNV